MRALVLGNLEHRCAGDLLHLITPVLRAFPGAPVTSILHCFLGQPFEYGQETKGHVKKCCSGSHAQIRLGVMAPV